MAFKSIKTNLWSCLALCQINAMIIPISTLLSIERAHYHKVNKTMEAISVYFTFLYANKYTFILFFLQTICLLVYTRIFNKVVINFIFFWIHCDKTNQHYLTTKILSKLNNFFLTYGTHSHSSSNPHWRVVGCSIQKILPGQRQDLTNRVLNFFLPGFTAGSDKIFLL